MLQSILLPMDEGKQTDFGLELAFSYSQKTESIIEGLVVAPEKSLSTERLEKKLRDGCLEKSIPHEFQIKSGEPSEVILNELYLSDILFIGKNTYNSASSPKESKSTFERVNQASFRPVMIIPEEMEKPNFDEAVIATDGSPASQKAVQMFTLLGLAKNYSKITVISVSQDLIKAEKNTSYVSLYLARHNVKAIEKPIQSEDSPWKPVIGYLENNLPSVLVMGVYGTGGIKEFFLGSFTSSLIKNSPIPIFTSK